MRVFEESHPWITFNLDTRTLSHKTWMLLGEAGSKCEHVAGVPLRPETAMSLNQIYLSKGIHGTTSIEGNTLSQEEVLKRVRGELPLPRSREYLGTEIDNVLRACNMVIDEVKAGAPLSLTPERIRLFNEMVLTDLELKEGVVPGQIRMHSVGVMGYRGAPAEDCEFLLEQLCTWLEDMQADDVDMSFPVAMFKAIMAHLYIAWIHPFGDGNGRTARLMEFQLLVQAGVPLPAAHLLSDHYNLTREMYYLELDRTSNRLPYTLDSFIHYALQGFVDELRLQLHEVRLEQMRVTWENYVHEQFRDEETAAKTRQKHVVLDLPDGPVATTSLPQLSPRLGAEYAGKQSKTITRDINALLEKNLIRRLKGGKIVANRELISAFLPLVAAPAFEK